MSSLSEVCKHRDALAQVLEGAEVPHPEVILVDRDDDGGTIDRCRSPDSGRDDEDYLGHGQGLKLFARHVRGKRRKDWTSHPATNGKQFAISTVIENSVDKHLSIYVKPSATDWRD